jgi:Protein of unknown function (DUF3626)
MSDNDENFINKSKKKEEKKISIDDLDNLREKAKKNCETKNKKDKYIAYFLDDPLTKIQREAVIYTIKKSKAFSKSTKNNIRMKFIQKSWDIDLIPKIIDHISGCDVIIHFKIERLHTFFKSDTQYRNYFEVHKLKDDTCARGQAENNLFSNIYSGCNAKEKVKYGCINLYNDKNGCPSACGYGESYIVLKSEVKRRCSFVCGDSFNYQMHLGNFEHFYHLLLYLKDSTIENLIKIVKGEDFVKDYYAYIECQIHGDVLWNRDIEKLMIKRSAFNENMRSSIENIPYDFF